MMLMDGSLKDPRLSAVMVTVTEVVMSPDLRTGRVFVSVFPEEEAKVRDVLEGLRSAVGEIKRAVHDRLALRYTPGLSFAFDASIANGSRFETLLKRIHAEEPSAPDADGESETERPEPAEDGAGDAEAAGRAAASAAED